MKKRTIKEINSRLGIVKKCRDATIDTDLHAALI